MFKHGLMPSALSRPQRLTLPAVALAAQRKLNRSLAENKHDETVVEIREARPPSRSSAGAFQKRETWHT
jgi:hypothetical protein